MLKTRGLALHANNAVVHFLDSSGFPVLSYGYHGIDFFFVLSGYLITRLIAQESDRTGTVHLGRFWLRRFRRLFAAAATMIVCCMAPCSSSLRTTPVMEEFFWPMAT